MKLIMNKVLIVAPHSFPPVNNMAARRYGEMVSYMPHFGWEPFVLTTKSSGDLAVEIPEENIIRIGEHYQKGLIIEAPGNKGLPKLLRPGYFLYKKLNLNLRSMDMFLFSLAIPMFKKLDCIKKIKPDIILASYGPATSLWVGNLLSWKIKKPWIADFRDPASLVNYSSGASLDKCIDKYLAGSASGIITIGPSLAVFLGKFYNKKVTVIFNGFRLENGFGRGRREKMTKKGKTIIYYAGRLTPSQMGSIKMLIKWLANRGRDDIVFTIRSLGFKEMNAQISSYAQDLKAANLVNILEPAEEETIKSEIGEADILTVFVDIEDGDPVAVGTITGKFLKLLPWGIPILVIGREDSDIGKILNETRAGFLASNPEQLSIAMEKILSGDLTHPVWDEIQKYSAENQCKNLCHLLDQVLIKS